jgi:hypothetical protein
MNIIFEIKYVNEMVSIETFKKIALSFEGTEQHPHFERIAFKVTGRRIFATLHEANESANVMLSTEEQSVYCSYDESAVYPVPNKWGLKGVTTFELSKVPAELVSDALYAAYKSVLKIKSKRK